MSDIIVQELQRINQMYTKLDELNAKCEDNMRRLNSMMLELKGIVATVRPQVKKTGWYGDEIEIDNKPYKISNALQNLE